MFQEAIPEDSFILSLEDLAQAYRARASEMDPDVRLAGGESPSEVATRIANVRGAYRIIRDVMDGRGQVWVSRWVSDAPRSQFVHVRNVHAPEIRQVAAPARGSAPSRSWNVRPAPSAEVKSFEPPVVRHVATIQSREGEVPVDSASRQAIYRDLMGPPRPLLGRYLVQQGLVSLSQLIAAVSWQRGQRPPVGRIAMEWGMLSSQDVIDLLRTKKARTPFCGHGVAQGVLQPVQRIAILAHQRQMQRPLGEYFVEHGILSRHQVESMVEQAKAVRV